MESNEFRFRPMNEGDLDQISEWFADFEDMAMFDRSLPVPVGKQFVAESWKSALQFSDPPKALWFVCESEDGEAVGIGGIQAINYIHGDAVVPVFVTRDFRGRGLALALMYLLANVAFEKLRLHRLTTFFRDDNKASRQISELMGFKEEGRAREGWFSEGKYQDAIQVGLLASEWQENSAAVLDRLRHSHSKFVNHTIPGEEK